MLLTHYDPIQWREHADVVKWFNPEELIVWTAPEFEKHENRWQQIIPKDVRLLESLTDKAKVLFYSDQKMAGEVKTDRMVKYSGGRILAFNEMKLQFEL